LIERERYQALNVDYSPTNSYAWVSPHNLTDRIDTMKNQVILGDCLEVMKDIPDKSIDAIISDLPYGTTACKWDTIIPFEPLWEQYKRIIKDNGAIVLTASQPFTSALVMSNVKMFKYEWIWYKNVNSNFMLAKKQPLRHHESICIFYKNLPTYNPQMVAGKPYSRKRSADEILDTDHFDTKFLRKDSISSKRYPKSVLEIARDERQLHPTQKPVALFEYFIKTYTNEGDLVLDNCAGSFTTAIASENLKRNWICIEQDETYCEIGRKRVEENRERLRVLDNCAKLDI
jgi:site-specific DNA-methyltransferase (adenine-specific)